MDPALALCKFMRGLQFVLLLLQNLGLPMVSASHVPMAGGGQLAVGHPSGLDQYIYQMPQVFSAGGAEMAAGHPTGALHYQRFDVGQLPMIDPVTQEVLTLSDCNLKYGFTRNNHHLMPYDFLITA